MDSRVLLIILDGFGEAPDNPGNAITRANMVFLNQLRETHPWTLLQASGNAVGLPEGYQGNSEVGHFTLGSGRITFQTFETINQSIREGKFFKHPFLMEACARIRVSREHGEKKALHLVGMISDEGVHSHIDHLFALLEMAKEQQAFPVFVHAILDGRDVPERSAEQYLTQLEAKIKELGLDQPIFPGGPMKASLASLVGRYYAMDRDSNWDRTKQAYDLWVHGTGKPETDPHIALTNAYAAGAETDYYIPPILLDPHKTIRNGDSIISFNYRTDRTRQITDAFVNKKFDQFPVEPLTVSFVALGPYTELAPVAFPTPKIENNLSHVLAEHGISQLRMAETEKYAHVTYFFNSQVEDPEPGEDRRMVASPKCPSYADQPAMSARPLTDDVIRELKTQTYRFVAMNYANADLVGHSGELEPTIECCKVLDECLGKLIPEAVKAGYTVFITGDHGNAEQMFYPDGKPCPAHTTNPVIGLLVSHEKKSVSLKTGKGLQDMAPTILELLNVPQPAEMTGESLLNP